MRAGSLMLIILFCGIRSYSQSADTIKSKLNEIAVLANVSNKSVSLRWAPSSLKIWQAGNQVGYVVERYTMTRDNKVIPPEKKILTLRPMAPEPVEQWEDLVKKDRYAAIAAQALYGDDFSVEIDNTNAISIANKIQESEQRFSISLLSADMSIETARKSALWISDTVIDKREKYLYRIIINADSTSYHGSVFVNPSDSIVMVPPKNLEAEAVGRHVQLKWRPSQRTRYSYFLLERSIDSVFFERVGEIPMITLSPTESASTNFSYATDSIAEGFQKYYYRVKGITPFGESSSPSNVVSVAVKHRVKSIPRIVEVSSIDNEAVKVIWEFSSEENSLIAGFEIERGSNDRNLTHLTSRGRIAPNERSFIDDQPLPSNYYRVSAISKTGERISSFAHFISLIDSIPPSAPDGLEASIDENGQLILTWRKNSEPDLFGYRVYKSNNSAEESFQMTAEPIFANELVDVVNLQRLNKFVFYNVAAVDHNQNQSKLSTQLKVALPDKVKPLPPVMLPPKSDTSSVTISWIQSGSVDVKSYDVYRAEPNVHHAIRLKTVLADGGLQYVFTDRNGKAGVNYRYSVISIDSAGNESIYSTPVLAKHIVAALLPAVVWEEEQINSEAKTVTLRWRYEASEVACFKLYKSIAIDKQFMLYKTIQSKEKEVRDPLQIGSCYKIVAVFKDGRKSFMSDLIQIQF